jgi:epoxyqueuosine reductase
MVCPWNHFALADVDPKLTNQEIAFQPDLAEEILLSQDSFNRKFDASPIQRAKRRGYRRNIIVAIGNSGDSSGITTLEQFQQDPDPLIREHAQWALDRIKDNMR